jgi:hypothetical protein
VLLTILFGGAFPRDAAAITWWEWLEQLSGPGPFHGWGVGLTFVCYGHRLPAPGTAEPDPSTPDSRELFLDLNCGRAARTRVHWGFRVEASWLSTNDNPLVYDPPPDPEGLEVEAFSFIPTVDVGLRQAVSVGFGGGFMHFSGDAFPSFTTLVIEPVRVTFKPLVLFATGEGRDRLRYGLEFLQLRYAARWLPYGVKAEDFGAVPGTFESGREYLSRFYVEVNAFHLIELF